MYKLLLAIVVIYLNTPAYAEMNCAGPIEKQDNLVRCLDLQDPSSISENQDQNPSGVMWPEEWTFCETSQDCEVMGHLCGKPAAINHKFHFDFNQKLGPSPYNCAGPSLESLYKSSCVNSVCVIESK